MREAYVYLYIKMMEERECIQSENHSTEHTTQEKPFQKLLENSTLGIGRLKKRIMMMPIALSRILTRLTGLSWLAGQSKEQTR